MCLLLQPLPVRILSHGDVHTQCTLALTHTASERQPIAICLKQGVNWQTLEAQACSRWCMCFYASSFWSMVENDHLPSMPGVICVHFNNCSSAFVEKRSNVAIYSPHITTKGLRRVQTNIP